MNECQCSEMSIEYDNKMVPLKCPESKPSFFHLHDCEYVKQRGALVRWAESNVLDRHGAELDKLEPEDLSKRWNKLFAAEMERLWRFRSK